MQANRNLTTKALRGHEATLHLYECPSRVKIRLTSGRYLTGSVEAYVEGPGSYIILNDQRIDTARIDVVYPA